MNVGDWVEVRTEAEILQTLDQHGRLDGMPFMPEMFRFCGQRFPIYKSAHKTCDGIAHQSRSLTNTVHLPTRCSGDAHGGCQTGCLLFWKEAWLRPVQPELITSSFTVLNRMECDSGSRCTRNDVLSYARVEDSQPPQYRCQATQIRAASTRLAWWNVWQYVRDVRSGNLDSSQAICGVGASLLSAIHRTRMAVGQLALWLRIHFRMHAASPSQEESSLAKKSRTPTANLNLVPGELVRVRSLAEIKQTLNSSGYNRGLFFDPEQVPYAGRTFRVLHRVDRIVNEETGRMIELKSPTVVLDSVVCQGRHSTCRLFCPRSAYAFWHEVWLERIQDNKAANLIASLPAETKTADVPSDL